MDDKGRGHRKYPRADKNFCVKYAFKNLQPLKFDIAQIKDISKGGVRFNASLNVPTGAVLSLELHVPYLDHVPLLEGEVVGCTEKVKDVIYELRVKFMKVDQEAHEVLEIIEQKFAKGE